MIRTISICLLALAALMRPVHAEDSIPWAVYYGSDIPAESFYPYQLVVFDSDASPMIRPLRNQGAMVLGYISLGEAEDYRHYFSMIKAQGLLLEENPSWPGHYIVDIRKPEWSSFLVETLIPAVLQKGFDGIFLDTADSLVYLEEKDPKRYAGMRDGLIYTIKKIRQHYPSMPIMLNRGFGVLPEVASSVSMVLAESIRVNHDPENKDFTWFGDDVYNAYVESLKQAQSISPELKVFTLDYWPTEDKAGVARIYAAHRAHGFHPYVSTLELNQLTPEPKN